MYCENTKNVLETEQREEAPATFFAILLRNNIVKGLTKVIFCYIIIKKIGGCWNESYY